MEFIASQLAALSSVVGSYGAAFALVGAVTYLVTAYFAYIGQKTIYRVNAVAPEIDRIKSELAGNTKELNRTILDMYAKEGINVSGFIVGLVPVTVLDLCVVTFSLAVASGLSGVHSSLLPWIHNIATPDPLYILPIALGLVYWMQRRLNLRFNPPRGSVSKRYISAGIPIFAFLTSAILPAGVAMYWLTYAALSITQQYVVFHHVLSV